MLKNYFTVAFRNLLRYKTYSLINIFGLAIGMTCCMLIVLFVQHELSYDQVHSKADRIYRVLRETRSDAGEVTIQAGTSGPLGPALMEEFPEIQTTVRVCGYGDYTWARYKDKQYKHPLKSCLMVDPNVLEVFDFPLIRGDRSVALQAPYSLVITQQTAHLYFGSEDPIGRIITIETAWAKGDYIVTGIVALPQTSSLKFDMLLSGQTGSPDTWLRGQWETWQTKNRLRPVQTFLLLRENEDISTLQAKLAAFMERHMGKEVQMYNTYHLQPLSRIHLYKDQDYGQLNFDANSEFLEIAYGNIQNIYLFSITALFILMIACVNFMNLSTARSANRAKEVGIRKVVGAYRGQIVRQFLSESILLSFLAVLLSIGLVELVLPYFNAFLGVHLSLGENIHDLLSVLSFVIFAGLMAGTYPAFFLSAFKPVEVLKGHLKIGLKGRGLRTGLVVFQFAVSILLIIGTITIFRQLTYMQHKKLGFNKELLIRMPIFREDRSRKSDPKTFLTSRYTTVKQAFLKHPNVRKATAYRVEMGVEGGVLREVNLENGQVFQALIQESDPDFLETFEIELTEGHPFLNDQSNEVPPQFILNETAVKVFGLSDPIGKRVGQGIVVGVMRDFHARSLREEIGPVILRNLTRYLNYLTVRIQGDNIPETMAFLEQTWKELLPDRPFEFEFIDESLNAMYKSEMRIGQLAGTFALMAIFVACLGLLGLASFSAEQRTKEIGIRKVLGASISGIVLLLSRDFAKWVLIANLIAWPVAFFVVQNWLQNFAYRVDITWWVFGVSGLLAFIIALLSVSYQAVRAALTNPVNALRNE
jgi:putative ABC transport system permease protein